jgi:hypothetical protein
MSLFSQRRRPRTAAVLCDLEVRLAAPGHNVIWLARMPLLNPHEMPCRRCSTPKGSAPQGLL